MGEFSIWHWAYVLVLLGVFFAFWAYVRRRQKSTPRNQPLSGVAGWLLWMVIVMMALNPLVGTGRLMEAFNSTEALYPNLTGIPAWTNYKLWTWCTFALGMAFSIWGGYGLWKGKTSGVVTRAQVGLWVGGPITAIATGILLPFFLLDAKELDPETVSALVSSAIICAGWSLYLAKSQRVRNTYPHSEKRL